MEIWGIVRFAATKYGVRGLSKILNLSPRNVYYKANGVVKLTAEQLRNLFVHTKDTDLINDFLEGTDHIAIKVRGLNLNGKWEDELKKTVELIGDVVYHADRGHNEKARDLLNQTINILAQWKAELGEDYVE